VSASPGATFSGAAPYRWRQEQTGGAGILRPAYAQGMREIEERVADARLLWREGRLEGAFLMALVAIAARARKESSGSRKDRQTFEQFIRSRCSIRLSVEFRGEIQTWERILYKWMRCELVHEGGLPVDVRFLENSPPGELSVRAGGAPEYVLLLSPAWFDQLLEWALA
jgi:hypothetical protein